MVAGGFRSSSGLVSYDVCKWRDWVPLLDRINHQGPLATLRQSVPATASGDNETDVPPGASHILLCFTGALRPVDTRIAGKAFRTRHGLGSLVLLPAGVDSWWRSTPEAAEGVIHLHLDPAFCDAVAEAEGLAYGADLPMLANFNDPLLTATAEALIASLAEPQPPSRLLWETAATSTALRLGRLGIRKTTSAVGAADWRIRRSIEEMEARLHEDLGLIELAGAVGLSPSHYAALFRASTGVPPHAWLVKRRIERACEMLANPRLAITEIAYALGFASSQHFSAAFRKHRGSTPSEWRRQHMIRQA